MSNRSPRLLAAVVALLLSGDAAAQAPALAAAAQGYGSSSSGVIDVDRDGVPDLVMLGSLDPGFPPPLTMVWGRGRGDGSFGFPQRLIDHVATPEPLSVFLPLPLALDADDDGLEDLVLLPRELYRALPGGGFDAPVPLPPGVASGISRSRVAVADLTGDGRQDLLVTGPLTTSGPTVGWPVLLLANGGDLSFATSTVNLDALDAAPYALAAVSVDGDALPDALLAVGKLGDQTLRVYPSRGGGAFGTPTSLPLTTLSITNVIRPMDFDADGDLDLLCGGDVVGDPDGLFVVLLGAGDGTFTEGPVVSDATAGAMRLDLADVVDVDGDGLQDAVLVSGVDPFVGLLPGVPGGGFGPVRVFAVPDGIYNIDYVRTELDGDASPEFLVVNFFQLLVVQGGGAFLDLGGGGTLPSAGLVLRATGSTRPGERTELSLHVPQPGLALLVLGTDLLALQPVGGGPFGVLPMSTRVVAAPTTLVGRWPTGLPDGTTFYVQAWVPDGAGVTTSNVVALVAETP